jgi:hypothetical protein
MGVKGRTRSRLEVVEVRRESHGLVEVDDCVVRGGDC